MRLFEGCFEVVCCFEGCFECCFEVSCFEVVCVVLVGCFEVVLRTLLRINLCLSVVLRLF